MYRNILFHWIAFDLANPLYKRELCIFTTNLKDRAMIRTWAKIKSLLGDALAFEFDVHYEINALGSKSEFVK